MINDALAAYAKSTARTFENRENTVGASEIGQCARKVYFAKNAGDPIYGAESDEDFADVWGARLRGQLFENYFWEPALRAHHGAKLLYAGADQKTLVCGFLSATPDGLLIEQPADALAGLGVNDIDGDASLVVECKTIDPRVKLDGARPEHTYQAIVQLGLFREVTKHRPEWAAISYVNASFLDDIIEFPVRFNPAVFDNAKKRAAQIAVATSASELKPERWIAGGRECEHCPFTQACGVIRHSVPTAPQAETVDPQFIAEISDLARDAKRQRGEVEAATAALREIEYDIKERLRAKNARQIKGAGVSVTWSAVKGRPSYDMPAIREAAEKLGLHLAEYETVGEPTDRLTIRVSEQSRSAT
jgi:hypothetical protein